MNKLILSLTVVIFTALAAHGQNEGNIWYFGANAGLDFNTGSQPSVLANSSLTSSEGSAVICSPSGQLLFYTDGTTIWNANHAVMPNGNSLLGNRSTTQSSIIIPRPGYKNRYYVFTLDDMGGADGLRYNEVDMSLNGGLGDVTATKNVLLEQFVTEKITAVRHANGKDYWVLVHDLLNTFKAYQVTTAGPQPAIKSTIGSSHAGPANTIGYMKFSPNGKKVACVVGGLGRFLELFDFDNATGLLSNPAKVDYTSTPYGVEFSPDNSKLYVSAGNNVFFYSLPAVNNSAALRNLEKTIVTDGAAWAIQAATNKKIYVCKQGKLGIINNPNADFDNINFIDNFLDLSPRWAIQGFPNSIQNLYIQNFIEASGTCAGENAQFIMHLNGLDSIQWNFGDVTSGASNKVTAFSPTHKYVLPGTYTVSARVFNGAYTQVLNQTITISPLPAFSLGNDTVLCKDASIVFNYSFPGASYMWNDGSNRSLHTISVPGLHYLDITINGCTNRDSLRVSIDAIRAGFTINNPTQCFEGNSFVFASTSTEAKHTRWMVNNTPIDNFTTVTTSFSSPGNKTIVQYVQTDFGCTDSLRKEILINPSPKAAFAVVANNNCGKSNSFTVTNKTSFAGSYSFWFVMDGADTVQAQNFTYKFTTAGTHKIKLVITTTDGCSDELEKQAVVFEEPKAAFTISPVNVCEGSAKFSITKAAPLQSYETIRWWADNVLVNTGDVTFSASFNNVGKHTIKAEVENTSGCRSVLEKEVEVFGNPTANFTTELNRENCLGSAPAKFISTTTGPNAITDYYWLFGDYTFSMVPNPVKSYTAASTYSVSLTVVDAKGCQGKVTKTISTYENPEAEILVNPINTCLSNNKFELRYKNNNSAASISSLAWETDYQNPAPKAPVTVSYPSVGDHLLKLILVSPQGCSDTAITTLTVVSPPAPSITTLQAEQCLDKNNFEFFASHTSAIAIQNFEWDFGNGVKERSILNPAITYKNSGDYSVTYTVTDINNCKASATTNVIVHPTPDMQIQPAQNCVNQPITLSAQANNTATIQAWQWEPGDGSVFTGASPLHIYTTAGKYTPLLTVVSDKGCKFSTALPQGIEVNALPEIDFKYVKKSWSFEETVLEFTATTSEPAQTYKWTFGNGKTGNSSIEQVKYEKAGYYTVSLEVESTKGCGATITKSVLIVPPFDAYVPSSFTPNGDGRNDYFTMEGVQFIKSFRMDIVNRWGQVIYTSTDLRTGWDGTLGGTLLPPDVYTYKIEIMDAEERPYSLQGSVQLIR